MTGMVISIVRVTTRIVIGGVNVCATVLLSRRIIAVVAHRPDLRIATGERPCRKEQQEAQQTES
jgi:hypothetical protein